MAPTPTPAVNTALPFLNSMPATAETPMRDCHHWLEEVQGMVIRTFPEKERVYVHPYVISYYTGAQKGGWKDYDTSQPDRGHLEHMMTIGKKKLINSKNEMPSVWVGLVDMAPDSYVGERLTDEQVQAGVRQWELHNHTHAWGWALVTMEKGKDLYIFDTDHAMPPPADFHVRDLRVGNQKKFVRELKRLNANLQRIFIGNAGPSNHDVDRCLIEAARWLHNVASQPGTPGDANQTDPRFPGFVEIGTHTG